MLGILTCVLLCTGAVPAQSPRYHRWVSADADLVLFFDVRAAGRSELGRSWLQRARRLPAESLEGITGWTRRLQDGVAKDIVSITAYTRPPKDAEAVVVVEIASSPDRLLAGLEDGVGYWKKTIDGAMVHSFRVEGSGSGGDGRRVYATLGPPVQDTHPVVFCHDLDQLSAAVGVIAGTGRQLAGSENPIAHKSPPQGVYLYLITTDSGKLGEGGPTSNLLRQSTGFALSAGEYEGEFRAELTLQAKSEESAANIAAMTNGLIALAQLIATNEKTDPDVRRDRMLLLSALDVTPRERDLLVRFRLPAARLSGLLQRNSERRKAAEAKPDPAEAPKPEQRKLR